MPGKHHLQGFKIAKKKIGSPLRGSDIAASRLLDDAPHRRWVKRLHCDSRCQEKHHLRGVKIAKKIRSPLRGSWTMLRIVVESTPPLGKNKARSAPGPPPTTSPLGRFAPSLGRFAPSDGPPQKMCPLPYSWLRLWISMLLVC